MKTPLAAPRAPFSLRAPAKINWFLQIVGQRDDGYHNISSLMQCISLYDSLRFEHSDSLQIKSDLDIPPADNLVHKAASLLKKLASCRKGARITLRKRIPVSAGLGGGSSDAATTLTGLNMLWGLNLTDIELSAIGAQIGSDVPFFFHCPLALVEGRGEVVTPLRAESSAILLLIKPGVSVSTKWAYELYDTSGFDQLTKKTIDIKLFCQAMERQDYAFLGEMRENNLEEVVADNHQIIREIKLKLTEQGAVISAMSGSGPTVFGVFKSRTMAERAAQAMKPEKGLIVETLPSVEWKKRAVKSRKT